MHSRKQHFASYYNSSPSSHCKKIFIAAAGNKSGDTIDDEPEAAVLLVACAIGLATGGGVVVFNNVIHTIRHYAWQETPVEATHWGRWARQLPFSSAVPVLVAPPVVGGIVVGSLRALTSFDDPTASKGKGQQGKAADPLSLYGNRATVPLQATQAALRDQTAAASTSGRDADTESVQHGWRQRLFPPSWQSRGEVQARMVAAPVLRALAAAITLGSGASLGPEGPSVDIGRSFAQALGSLLRSKRRLLLPLIAAGSGAGVAAGFNAPISGVFFAVESVLQRPGMVKDEAGSPMSADSSGASFSSALTVAMVLLASVVAAVVSQAGLGASPAFRVPEYELQSMFELPLVLVLGALCGLASSAFKASSQVSDRAFRRMEDASSGVIGRQAQQVLWPALGGLATGVVALAYPEVLYQGFGNVNGILEARGGDYAPLLLLQIVAAKILTTSVCQRSGLVGGVYAPSIFMGAALGSAFGGIAAVVGTPLGLVVTAPQAYALVGVAGMLAALCQVPLTAVLLLFELTHDYFIIIPTLASVGISYWVASFPIASLLQPLSPVFRQWLSDAGSPLSSSVQARTAINEEVSAAVSEALSGEASLGNSVSPLLGIAAPQLGSTEATPREKGGVMEACVMLTPDTSLSEALQVMDEAGESVAMVLDDSGSIIGVLTRASVEEAQLAAQAHKILPQN
ncbi:hypothetical protein WJX75_007259 [Coccomyxa subellipsoidea]|uniref:Chloride channel protein n=1 Tax=Coccomyxa subellipsoidea TaxID=248742 RepID=A0ABR2YS52_9CHLO